MMRKFGEVVPVKMAEAGLDIDCNVVANDAQAEFFYAALQRLDAN